MGLTMLAAGTLESIGSVYVTIAQEKRLQPHKVNHYLRLFGEKYSSYLYEIVRGLLVENHIHRLKCSAIYAMLYPHEERILDLEPFMHPRQSSFTPSYQQQPRQSLNSYKVNYVVSGQSRPVTNMFYSQNGGPVSPVESKYVPMSQYQSGQQGAYTSPAHLSLPPARYETISQQSLSRNSIPLSNQYRI